MDFTFKIIFTTQKETVIERTGVGMFHPSDDSFKLEHMLWLMAEEFGRPTNIDIEMKFWGATDGTTTSKRIEGPKTTA